MPDDTASGDDPADHVTDTLRQLLDTLGNPDTPRRQADQAAHLIATAIGCQPDDTPGDPDTVNRSTSDTARSALDAAADLAADRATVWVTFDDACDRLGHDPNHVRQLARHTDDHPDRQTP